MSFILPVAISPEFVKNQYSTNVPLQGFSQNLVLRLPRTSGQSQPQLQILVAGLRWLGEKVENQDSHRSTEGQHLKSCVYNIFNPRSLVSDSQTRQCENMQISGIQICIAIEQIESQAEVHFDHLPTWAVPILMFYAAVRVCQKYFFFRGTTQYLVGYLESHHTSFWMT